MKRTLRIAAAFGAGMVMASIAMADPAKNQSAISAEVQRETTAILDLSQCVLPPASKLDAILATGTYVAQDETAKKSMSEAAMEMVKCSLEFKRTYIGKSM